MNRDLIFITNIEVIYGDVYANNVNYKRLVAGINVKYLYKKISSEIFIETNKLLTYDEIKDIIIKENS